MSRRYRSSKIWVWFCFMLPVGAVVCTFFIVAGTWVLVATFAQFAEAQAPHWFQVLFAIGFFGLASVGGAIWLCGAIDMTYELTLEPDGTCVFRTLLRRKRVRADRIVSVEADEDTIVVQHQGGRVRLLEPDDFPDFVARLELLSPGARVRGPDRWHAEPARS